MRKQYRAAFGGAMLCGFAAHAVAFFGGLSGHDDIYNLFDVGTTWYIGRFMLGIAGKLVRTVTGTGHFSLPWLHGLITLLFLSMTACMLCGLFGLRSPVSCAVFGALTTTMPYTAAFFGFMFTAPYYAAAVCLSAVSCCLVLQAAEPASGEGSVNGKKRLLLPLSGVLLLSLCAGIYQAVLPFAAAVFLGVLAVRAVGGERDHRRFFTSGAICACALAASLALYLALMRVFLKLLRLELSDYGGMNEMDTVRGNTYLSRAADAYRVFFLPDRTASFNMYPATTVWLLRAAIAGLVILAVLAVKDNARPQKASPLLVALPLALFPLAVNGVFVMNGKPFIHSLVMFPQTLVFLLLIACAERVGDGRRAIRLLAAGLVAMLVLLYIRYDNICYFSASYLQRNVEAYFQTLVTRIKSVEGYNDTLPVVYIGERAIADDSLTLYPEFDAVITVPYANSQEVYLNDYAWRQFMAYRCGFSPAEADAEPFLENRFVMRMPSYPDDGSIQVIDGTVVVKLK